MSTEVRLTNPFPGLRPYREDEAYLFFGRESQVDSMVDKLKETRFLAVIGSSGSGKSSLVNCGLLPALHGGSMTDTGAEWRVAHFRPGRKPISAMAHELSNPGVLFQNPISGDTSTEDVVEATLRSSKLGLRDICQQARLDSDVNLLIVVDQFEELFRYEEKNSDTSNDVLKDEATAFIKLLLETKNQSTLPIFVVITMRSDHLDDCTHYLGLTEAINSGQYLVPRMTREERKAAILGPAAVAGGKISPLLLTRLVNDCGDNPDQLSQLQHALYRTWGYWKEKGEANGPLDLEHYKKIGEMDHALDIHAEEVFEKLGSPELKAICEKLFKVLVDPVSAPNGTRKPKSFGKLCDLIDADPAKIEKVIEAFRQPSCSFLLASPDKELGEQSIIDISHESLMRIWVRLRGWAQDEQDSVKTFRRLQDSAHRYYNGKSSELIRGTELFLALEWFKKENPNNSWAALYGGGLDDALKYLESSEKQELRDQAEKGISRDWKMIQFFLFGLLAVFCVAAITADQIIIGIPPFPSFAQTEDRYSIGHNDAVNSAVYSDKNKYVATASADGTAQIYDLRDSYPPRPLRVLYPVNNEEMTNTEITNIALSPDGSSVVTTHSGVRAMMWNLEQESPRLLEPEGISLEFAREILASIGPGIGPSVPFDSLNSADQENVTTRLEYAEIARRNSRFDEALLNFGEAYDIHPGNPTAAIGLNDIASQFLNGDFELNRNQLDEINTLLSVPGLRNNAALIQTRNNLESSYKLGAVYSPDGNRFVTASFDTVEIWDNDPLSRIASPDPSVIPESLASLNQEAEVSKVIFSRDGSLIVTADVKGKVKIWNQKGIVVYTLPHENIDTLRHEDAVVDVAFSTDDRQIATASLDKTVKIWNLEGGYYKFSSTLQHDTAVRDVAFSPDGGMISTRKADGTVSIWEVNSGNELQHCNLIESNAEVIALSPDGSKVASRLDGDASKSKVAVRDIRTCELFTEIEHEAEILGFNFSSDSKEYITAGADNTAKVTYLRYSEIYIVTISLIIHSLLFLLISTCGKILFRSRRLALVQ